MRTFKFIGLTLIAVVLCFGISACSLKDELIGEWKITNSPEGKNIGMIFSEDGILTGINYDTGETIEINWTRKDDDIYVAKEGEREVAVFHILSSENNTLVLKAEGDPDIMYLKRKE